MFLWLISWEFLIENAQIAKLLIFVKEDFEMYTQLWMFACLWYKLKKFKAFFNAPTYTSINVLNTKERKYIQIIE